MYGERSAIETLIWPTLRLCVKYLDTTQGQDCFFIAFFLFRYFCYWLLLVYNLFIDPDHLMYLRLILPIRGCLMKHKCTSYLLPNSTQLCYHFFVRRKDDSPGLCLLHKYSRYWYFRILHFLAFPSFWEEHILEKVQEGFG